MALQDILPKHEVSGGSAVLLVVAFGRLRPLYSLVRG